MSTTAWLFPGQGSQAVGMGKDVLDASPAAREVFARADEALHEPLSRLILEGPEDQLTLTANAQPAIVATSCAILAAICQLWPVGTLRVADRGVREGILLSLMRADAKARAS